MNTSPCARLALALLCLSLVPALRVAAGVPVMPMPVVEADTTLHRWRSKPVLVTRLLDGMERTNAWSHHGVGRIEFTTERAHDGRQSVRIVSATKTDTPSKNGRPFAECSARRNFAGEDWGEFNRLSFWVYPHLPGFKVISLLVKLTNAGDDRVPDQYGREGLNYVLLKPDQWSQVVWEIPHLARDKVTAVEFVYRLQGHEPGATDTVQFDVDQLELQQVEADTFEGWGVAPGRIAYSQSGYLPEARKTALAGGLSAGEFQVVDARSKKEVFRGTIRSAAESPTAVPPLTARLQVLDFSAVTRPGRYWLEAGQARTPAFSIDTEVWRDSIWKTINSFYCQRCGQAIPGIHDVCHQDWRAIHGGATNFIPGGWHDAGDLSQGLVNSSEAIYAMLTLAEALQDQDRDLPRRLLEEARWGLAWLRKTRFEDGSRMTWATMDYWTDGELGNVDDTFGEVRNSPYDNFMAACAEARAAQVLRRADAPLAQASAVLARQDWLAAMDRLGDTLGLEVASMGCLASIELFRVTGESLYADQAVELARVIAQCQQREWTPWDRPAEELSFSGFFYTNPKRQRIQHYSHRGHEQAPIVALAALCETLPDHADWMEWYAVIARHSEYLRTLARFTAPYHLLPASIYALDESTDPRFRDQVKTGVRLDDQHYLRVFPVWFDLRGNSGTVLSQTKALSTAARLRHEPALDALVQEQLQWHVGRNPFAQSLMFGEGHDYAPQYTAMSGDLVGSLPVGVQTRKHFDLPYWPAANCYNYKEVWVHPSSRWLAIQADLAAGRTVPKSRLGPVEIGERALKLVDGVETRFVVELRGKGAHQVVLRASNLSLQSAPEQTVVLKSDQPRKIQWTVRIVNPKEPVIAVVVPDGDTRRSRDFLSLQPMTAVGPTAR
jgi:hypothetical protein